MRRQVDLSSTGHLMKRIIDKENEDGYNRLSHISFAPNFVKSKECLIKAGYQEMHGGYYCKKTGCLIKLEKHWQECQLFIMNHLKKKRNDSF